MSFGNGGNHNVRPMTCQALASFRAPIMQNSNVHVAGAYPKSYYKKRERRYDAKCCPSQHYRLPICLFGPVHDLVRLRACQHNILLQLSADRRHTIIELRGHKLAGTGLHLSDSGLELRQMVPYHGLYLPAGFLEISLANGGCRENRIIFFHPDPVALGYEAYDLLTVWSDFH
jgi:hypothetical protein